MSVVHPIRLDQRVSTLLVNGERRECRAEPTDRLVDVLRDEFGLTGTKVGCGVGDCGACTVLLDGQAVCACITPVGRIDGAEVTTIEALADGPRMSRLQQAFHALGAAQCGICTPGMLMASEALLRRVERPTEDEVKDALGGVLCRCTGYRKIIEAVMAAGGTDLLTVQQAPRSSHAVGYRLPRIDAPDKLTGRTVFGADDAPPGCLWARAIRSPHAHARFAFGDLEQFRLAYGLVAVLTADAVPNNRFAIFDQPKDQPVLAADEVRFKGEAVLLLVGEKGELAACSDADVPITWEVLPALDSLALALEPGAFAIHAFASDNVLCRGRVVRGDADAALNQAAFVAEGEFDTAYVEHAYIEPEAGYAQWLAPDRSGTGLERIRIFACTQTPYMDRDEVARIMMLLPEQIHIVPSTIGGGFGGKLDLSVQPLLAVAAHAVKGAVRMIYQRDESMRSTTKRHPSEIRVRMGCDSSGKLTGIDFHADFNTGAYASWGSTVANRVPVHATGTLFRTARPAL